MHHLGLLVKSYFFFLNLALPLTKLNQMTRFFEDSFLWSERKSFQGRFLSQQVGANNYRKLQTSGTLQINFALGAKENHRSKDAAAVLPAACLHGGKWNDMNIVFLWISSVL